MKNKNNTKARQKAHGRDIHLLSVCPPKTDQNRNRQTSSIVSTIQRGVHLSKIRHVQKQRRKTKEQGYRHTVQPQQRSSIDSSEFTLDPRKESTPSHTFNQVQKKKNSFPPIAHLLPPWTTLRPANQQHQLPYKQNNVRNRPSTP